MLPENIHTEICAALQKAGGTPCEELIGDPEAIQTDIHFADFGVFVEVKTLTEDRNKKQDTRLKAGKILDEGARAGDGPVFFGDVSVPLKDLPPGIAEKLLLNMGNRVRKNLISANKQITETATRLALPARGLVLIAVPSHFSTHAGVIATVAARVLRPGKFKAIEAIFIISVPTIGADNKQPLVMSFCPRLHSRLPESLVDLIANAWMAHLSEIDGAPISIEEGTADQFDAIFIVGDDDWPGKAHAGPR